MAKVQQYLSGFASRGVRHEGGAAVLDVADLAVRYDGKTVLEEVSFQLVPGERMAIVGPNGAGKSTLFKAVAGLVPATEGTVNVYGHEPGSHICIGYVPQRSEVDWGFPVNVFEVVMMGRIRRMGLFRWPRRADRDNVWECLNLVGMANLAQQQIGALSGGQQQRVFIARALAQEAELMMMDEPFTGLDLTTQEDIFHILDKLRQHNVTVMVATHDLNQAAERFDRVMLLNRRMLGVGDASEVFKMDNLQAAYSGHVRVLRNGEGETSVVVDTCCGKGAACEVARNG
jgi:ABC-type Mn2+/Zn2+ transport system ATPase subunit